MRRLIPLLSLLSLLAACSSGPSPRSVREAETSQAAIASWVAEGRALLEAGRPEDAEALFARAVEADDTLATRHWLLRAWMDQGRSDETLDALDALSRAGESGPELDYLYGMAFARRAEGLLRDGVTDNSVQMNFLDAVELLHRTLASDEDAHADGYPALAKAAWYAQDLETARWASDRAVEHYPDDPRVWLTRGKIVMSQFVVAQKAGQPGAEAAWAEAVRSLQHAVERFGAPTGAEDAAALADAATELGHAQMWKKDAAAATRAYATAMAWAPETFDFAQALTLLRAAPTDPGGRPAGFRAALEQALLELRKRSAGPQPAEGTLLWWLGWARFDAADWSAAEAAFQDTLAARPDYVNSWFYIGLARQYSRDSEGALAAMHRGWEADPSAMVAVISSSGGSLRAFENLIGWCAENDRNLEAAFLSQMLAETFPDEARYWNNLGLFLRDEGERLEIEAYKNKTPEPAPEVLEDLYGRAYRAYQRALELNPTDPQLLNDTAVMLDYHLELDQDQIEPMYRRAIAAAEALLAETDLSEADRERFQTTLDDASKNLEYRLHPEKREEDLAKARAKAAAKKAEEAAKAAEEAVKAAQEAAQAAEEAAQAAEEATKVAEAAAAERARAAPADDVPPEQR